MKVLEPKISKVDLDFERTLKDSQEINVNLNANITYSNKNNDKYLITEKLEMFLNNGKKIFIIEAVCPVVFEQKDEKNKINRQEIIKTEIFPILYKKIKEISDFLLSNATVELPSLPERLNQI